MTSNEFAAQFRALHVAGQPLVLFNIWDAGSARAVAAAGARAIATGSWSVAAAHGVDDGERLPLEAVLDNLRRIAASVDLPVTLDFESGYGDTPACVGESIAAALQAGAIGFNIEDRHPGGDGLRALDDQLARLRAARDAAARAGVDAFLNTRTDLFLQAPSAQHDTARLDAALERAHAYAQAGADGFFVPGLVDETAIARVCRECPLPVNVMMLPSAPNAARLADLGVARVSHGPGPYRLAMQALTDAARVAHANQA